MVLTDTHTHLYYEPSKEKLAGLIQRSLTNKVSRLFLPNVNSKTIPLVFDLTNQYPQNCFPMLGLHPCDVKDIADDETDHFLIELANIKQDIHKHKIYAIGEIGIDLYWDKTTLNIQKQAFKTQIAWAKELNLPVVIHCRDAFNEVFEILKEEKDDKLFGIFHCFTGTLEQARELINLGFYLGIGGVLTYKNSGLDKVIHEISLEHLVLETDSPYLAPVPHRGKPNESSYLTYIAQKVADIKQIPLEEVANITTENSKKIFNI
ncbi:MAG: TatD family hydrolase [Daejeonella sp.]